jgi:deazaflavin-dependent oxidoreductase (nitroreductase family)
MATLETPLSDVVPVHEMVVIHRIFREEFGRLARLVRRCPDGHQGWARRIGEHADFVVTALHHHHTTEDELLWPLLLERARPEQELIHRMEGQHQAIAGLLEAVVGLFATWREAPTSARGAELADTLDRLTSSLVEHLDGEEAHVLPLAARHLTAGEWRRIGDASFAKFSTAEKFTALGVLLEDATPEEAEHFFADLPVPVRAVWWVSGRRRYARYVDRLEGRFNPTLRRWMRRANHLAVALYRASGGRVGGSAKGVPVLLLTVAGRRSGIPRTVPVGYVHHGGEYVVAGTAGGSPVEPQWFGNLRAATRVEVQVRADHWGASSRVLGEEERDRVWREVVLPLAPAFGTYVEKCARPIPLAVLTPDR